MDPVTQLKLDTFLNLLLYPVLALATVAAIGLAARRGAEGQTRPGVTAVALAVALTISWVGIVAFPALPPVDTRDYTPFFALLLPLPFLALESRPRLAFVAPLAGLAVVLMLWLYLKPIMGGEYAPVDRVAQVGALMLLVWLGVDRLAAIVPGPTTLSALCFAAIGAAVAALVSGTAIIGQALGGIAAVMGVASLIAWRLPRLAVGRAAVAAALVPFFGSLVFAHFYGDLPAVPAAIAALSPLGLAAALPLRNVVVATIVAGVVAFIPAGGAAYYAKQLSDAKHAADAPADNGGVPVQDWGSLK
jgi:hypothetical protein